MKSVAAERTLKFILGAIMGFGFGLAFLASIRESPLVLGGVWLLGTLATGVLGMRVLNISGRFRVVAEGEQDRLRPSDEVKLVIGYALLGVFIWVMLG